MARSDSAITRLITRSKASRTPFGPPPPTPSDSDMIDLRRRRDQLTARVAELQFDLGGLVYEMAVRDQIRVDVLVQRAAVLQDADAELGEVERILRMDQTGAAGSCPACGAPHSPSGRVRSSRPDRVRRPGR
jgi:hypothetical protein